MSGPIDEKYEHACRVVGTAAQDWPDELGAVPALYGMTKILSAMCAALKVEHGISPIEEVIQDLRIEANKAEKQMLDMRRKELN